MTLEAKPIVKNKFWIVEDHGQKIATIQSTKNGVVYVQGEERQPFIDFKTLKQTYNIRVGKIDKQKQSNDSSIYGFPTTGRAYNAVFDVKKKLPFFTRTAKSKSYYCAGYYAVLANGRWQSMFCPKAIAVKRYNYEGPFKTESEAQAIVLQKITQAQLNT